RSSEGDTLAGFPSHVTPTSQLSTLSLHDALPICTRPASTSCRVTARSSADGVGSPLGWLWTTMMPAAASAIAARNTSRGCTRELDRKSTRLNSSHEWISYAVLCLKKKTAFRCD